MHWQSDFDQDANHAGVQAQRPGYLVTAGMQQLGNTHRMMRRNQLFWIQPQHFCDRGNAVIHGASLALFPRPNGGFTNAQLVGDLGQG